MANTLKPCPFCGGEAHLEQYPDAPEYFAIVRCSKCDIRAVKDTDEEAIEAWNKRAQIMHTLEDYQAELIALQAELDKFIRERTIRTIRKNKYISELEQLCRDLRECAIHTSCATCEHENSACAIERFNYLQL